MSNSGNVVSIHSLVMTGYEDGFRGKKWRQKFKHSSVYRASHREGRNARTEVNNMIQESKNGNA